MILFFSGTGNSRYCARRLGEALQDTCVDAFHYIRDGIAGEFASQKPWVFVCPTYCWQIPRDFAQFLRRAKLSGSRDVYFVMTCGGEVGNAPAANRALCAELDLVCHGTFSIVMPDNYIIMFPAPTPEETQKLLAAAPAALQDCADTILAGKEAPEHTPGFADKLKSGVVNSLFYRFNMQPKKFTVSDACISCGKCEKVCPLGNIRMQDGKPVWGNRCTHCMACISDCPAVAIEYGKSTRGKARYHCPEGQES